jgi:hypothetical protein
MTSKKEGPVHFLDNASTLNRKKHKQKVDNKSKRERSTRACVCKHFFFFFFVKRRMKVRDEKLLEHMYLDTEENHKK